MTYFLQSKFSTWCPSTLRGVTSGLALVSCVPQGPRPVIAWRTTSTAPDFSRSTLRDMASITDDLQVLRQVWGNTLPRPNSVTDPQKEKVFSSGCKATSQFHVPRNQLRKSSKSSPYLSSACHPAPAASQWQPIPGGHPATLSTPRRRSSPPNCFDRCALSSSAAGHRQKRIRNSLSLDSLYLLTLRKFLINTFIYYLT